MLGDWLAIGRLVGSKCLLLHALFFLGCSLLSVSWSLGVFFIIPNFLFNS